MNVLSLRLYGILDEVGASEEDRRERQRVFRAIEILDSLPKKWLFKIPIDTYVFGSSFEGTSTDGMLPDVDILHAIGGVCQDTDSCPDDSYVLLVQDGSTAAGYGKLQLLTDRCDSVLKFLLYSLMFGTVNDGTGKTFLSNTGIRGATFNLMISQNSEQHGPAVTGGGPVKPQDTVYALRCKEWPCSAEEWLTRPRKYNWPPPQLIEKMKGCGFFLVPIGHPQSGEQNKEWRISLSLQERLLMQNLNPVQFKCYVLLKLLKKNIICHIVGEESLTSYHCKTCLFYMIENTSEDFWRPENLLTCCVSCLEQLADWTEEGVCPNYFIPEENMFERRVNGQLRIKLHDALSRLLQSKCQFLIGIQTDGICKRLRNACSDTVQIPLLNTVPFTKVLRKVNLYNYGMSTVLQLINFFLVHQISGGSNQVFQYLTEQRKIKTVTEHTETETRDSLSLLLPYVELCLLSKMFTEVKQNNDTEKVESVLFSGVWNEISLASDGLTAKLKQATYLYMTGNEKASLHVLQSILNTCPNQVSACVCFGTSFDHDKLRDVAQEVFMNYQNGDMTKELFLCKNWAPCVSFWSFEKDIIPEVFIYEMRRSETTSGGTILSQLLNDAAVIDGKILLQFLLYLNHSKVGMNVDAKQDLIRLEMCLENDKLLSHRGTDYNLLGWAYKQQRSIPKAVECFWKSISLQREKNSAWLHLQDINN